MDPSEFPFDIEAYKKQSEIEEKYIINRFRERRNKVEEDYPPRSKRKYFKRDHAAANQRLIDDYFSNQPIYDDAMFRRRFRMRKHVFLRIVEEPDKLFAQHREGCRKDIEHAFGVLQARFKTICEPGPMWDITDLAMIMRSCIILHNMIVEDERDTYVQQWTDYDQSEVSGSSTPRAFSTEVLPAFANHVRTRSELRHSNIHHELQADLVKHMWAKFGMFRN